MKTSDNEEVLLSMMLECREKRAKTQQDLISRYGKPVISFTMNIAGPVKTNYLIERGFFIGTERLLGSLFAIKATVLYKEMKFSSTGPEGFFVVDLNPEKLKSVCVEIEDMDSLGRLFDIDVITTDCNKVEREHERHCLLCDRPAKECSSRRIHPVEQLWEKTNTILNLAVVEHDSNTVASMAVKALMFEVLTTPKPGLVDRNNNGSHKDMDLFTFSSSASVLFPYFKEAYSLGWNSDNPEKCFIQLRKLGKKAEQSMFFETKGVNTHKGAVFTLGIISCAAGFVATNGGEIFNCCSQMTKGIIEKDFNDNSEFKTNGRTLYEKYGFRGIRGEIEDGLPSVKNLGLPLLEKSLESGLTLEESGSKVLLALISQVSDTNMIARGGVEKAGIAMKMARDLLNSSTSSKITELDDYFISENLSPGGSADLLSVCYLIHFLREQFNV